MTKITQKLTGGYSMEEILNNISDDHFVANFEELVIENQIQTAIDVLS
jgi:hypothetical protein